MRSPTSETRLRRLALALFALLVLVTVAYAVATTGLDRYPAVEHDLRLDVGELFGITSMAVVGLLLTWARPSNPIGWVISAAGLSLALCDLGQTYGARALLVTDENLPLGEWAMSFSAPLWVPALFLPATTLLVRYPGGRVTGRWARRADRAALLGFLLIWLVYAMSPESVTDEVPGELPPVLLPEVMRAPIFGAALVLLLGATLWIVGDAVRRAVGGDRAERLALLWLGTTSVLAVVVIFFGPVEWLGSIAYFAILVAVAIGVLRYQALGVEIVVRRTIVYSILTGVVLLVFVGVVSLLAEVVPSGPAPEVVAAVVIAVGLAPARDRLQSWIDRLLFGERGDPFAALHRLGSPIGSAPDDELLAGVLGALDKALNVEGAHVLPPGADAGVALVFGGVELGRLAVPPRRGETALGKADQRLLGSVAPLVAAVLHAERERDRVVEATQAERKRLRQELHDGLGPSLTGVGLGLEAAQRSGASDELLGRLRTEVSASLEEVRRIIDDLRPSALDDQDLLTALRRRAEQVTTTGVVSVELEAPATLPDLPPSVAAAAFRIADEALANVVRHSSATRCVVQLRVDDQLHLEVSDDGVGPGSGREGGVGLTSMRERAERLGGRFTLRATDPGTSVCADLPLAVTP